MNLPNDCLDDEVFDGLPYGLCVQPQLTTHVLPQSQQAPWSASLMCAMFAKYRGVSLIAWR